MVLLLMLLTSVLRQLDNNIFMKTPGKMINNYLPGVHMKKGSKKISVVKEINLSDFDLGWIIGLIEGEGCFTDYTNPKTGHYCVQMLVASTDKDVIDRLVSLVNMGRVGVKDYTNNEKFRNVNGDPYKTQWWWTISDRSDFRSLCTKIVDKMSERRSARIRSILHNISKYEEPNEVT